MEKEKNIKNSPLADRMRPKNLNEFVGQGDIVGEGKMLRLAIESDQIPSILFWGPPGTGKTTLAHIIAEKTNSEFLQLSAVTSGLKELRAVISEAKANQIEGKKTILFIDEIHRWNKKQQDALLPQVEQGIITLIGATTENPSFEVISALMSRCRVFVLKSLESEHIKILIERALNDKERGLKGENITVEDDAKNVLSEMSNGDARTALKYS
jgi:putative ATPase